MLLVCIHATFQASLGVIGESKKDLQKVMQSLSEILQPVEVACLLIFLLRGPKTQSTSVL